LAALKQQKRKITGGGRFNEDEDNEGDCMVNEVSESRTDASLIHRFVRKDTSLEHSVYEDRKLKMLL